MKRRRADLDSVFTAHATRKRESAAVQTAYSSWARATTSDARAAFAAYRLALDREELAADAYARLFDHARLRAELNAMALSGTTH